MINKFNNNWIEPENIEKNNSNKKWKISKKAKKITEELNYINYQNILELIQNKVSKIKCNFSDQSLPPKIKKISDFSKMELPKKNINLQLENTLKY